MCTAELCSSTGQHKTQVLQAKPPWDAAQASGHSQAPPCSRSLPGPSSLLAQTAAAAVRCLLQSVPPRAAPVLRLAAVYTPQQRRQGLLCLPAAHPVPAGRPSVRGCAPSAAAPPACHAPALQPPMRSSCGCHTQKTSGTVAMPQDSGQRYISCRRTLKVATAATSRPHTHQSFPITSAENTHGNNVVSK